MVFQGLLQGDLRLFYLYPCLCYLNEQVWRIQARVLIEGAMQQVEGRYLFEKGLKHIRHFFLTHRQKFKSRQNQSINQFLFKFPTLPSTIMFQNFLLDVQVKKGIKIFPNLLVNFSRPRLIFERNGLFVFELVGKIDDLLQRELLNL